jgi:hypothetical protein
MHRGAFFWVKIDMEKAYRRGARLAIVLEKRVMVIRCGRA